MKTMEIDSVLEGYNVSKSYKRSIDLREVLKTYIFASIAILIMGLIEHNRLGEYVATFQIAYASMALMIGFNSERILNVTATRKGESEDAS